MKFFLLGLQLMGCMILVSCDQSCSIENSKNGIHWTSPGFELGRDYPNNIQCDIGASTESPHQAIFTFNSFNLQGKTKTKQGRKCVDALTINLPRDRKVEFCGKKKGVYRVPNFRFKNEFASNKKKSASGFNITVKAVKTKCHQVIDLVSSNRTEGFISTPNFPQNFPKFTQCEWWIKAPEAKQIRLQIKTIQIQESDQCKDAYVVVDSAGDKTYPMATSSIFCGTVLGKTFITSKSNSLNVVFHGGKQRDVGFKAYYQAI